MDASAARIACGFPTVTNITSTGFAISVMTTKPAWAFYVVMPTSQARALRLVGMLPSVAPSTMCFCQSPCSQTMETKFSS